MVPNGPQLIGRVENLASKPDCQTGGWGFLNKFLLSLLRDCWRTRPSGPSRCPRFCGSQRYVRKTTQACREGPHSEEQVLGSPRVLLGSPRFVQGGHKVFFQKGLLSVKTLDYYSGAWDTFLFLFSGHIKWCLSNWTDYIRNQKPDDALLTGPR